MNIALLSALVNATNSGGFMYTSTADHGPLVQAGFAEVNGTMANPNGDGSLATRATEAGKNFVASQASQAQSQPVTDFSGQPAQNFGSAAPQGQVQSQPVVTSANVQGGFVVGTGFVPSDKPKASRDSGEGEKYPFSQLAAPTVNADGTKSYSFVFVPATKHTKGDKAGQLRNGDEMAFSLQSACNAATRRFAEVVGTEQRQIKGETKTVNKYKHTRKFAVQGGQQNGVVGAFIYREA